MQMNGFPVTFVFKIYCTQQAVLLLVVRLLMFIEYCNEVQFF